MKMPEDATPLSPEDLLGLKPNLKTRAELDEFEQANILRAQTWALKSRKLRKDLLSATGLYLLHEKMFSDTWTWAGKVRERQTSIGVEPHRIQNDLGILLGDIKYWVDNQGYSVEEIAIRLHHRLVAIHPFPNGNGRFSRLAADLFLIYNNHSRFTWNNQNLAVIGPTRKTYIEALQIADREMDYSRLLEFARS